MGRSLFLATSLAAAGCSPGAHDHAPRHDDHAPGRAEAHSPARAALVVRPDPGRPRAGEPVTLHLMIHTAHGRMVRDFVTAHESKVHLIVVGDGLDRFAHLHPRADTDGNLTVTHTFPAGGTYRLFADYTEAGKGPAVADATVKVGGEAPPARPLAPTVPGRVTADGVEVAVAVIAAGHGATGLGFTIAAGGRPVADLLPYLGAAGHLMLVSADGARYVHVHPAGGDPVRGRIEFEAHVPAAGLYRGWLQFRRGDRVHTVPFVLRAGD